MSVKKPWDSEWKSNCRSRIKGCHGVIVLITKNLRNAHGALWEIKCAKEEGKPLLGVYIGETNIQDAPSELHGITKVTWSWPSIAQFVNAL
jgi:CTP synthase (UTP-ammonia lyase)